MTLRCVVFLVMWLTIAASPGQSDLLSERNRRAVDETNSVGSDWSRLSIKAQVDWKVETDGQQEICLTAQCVTAAAQVISRWDPSADPCEDFAQYACGKFYKNVMLPLGKTKLRSFDITEEQSASCIYAMIREERRASDPKYMINAKNFYQACMDETKIEKIGLEPFLNTPYAREWPILIGKNWTDRANFDFNKVLVRYMEQSVQPLFQMFMNLDRTDSTKMTIVLYTPELEEDIYLTPRNSSKLQATETYLRKLAIELGADPTVAEEDVKAVVDLRIYLANIVYAAPGGLNLTTLGALRQIYPHLELARALRAAYSSAQVTLSDDLIIDIPFPSYFENLQAVLENTDNRTLMNLFGFEFAHKTVKGLTKKLREILLDRNKVLEDKQTATPRFEQCQEKTLEIFGFGLSKIFTNRKFSEESKKSVNDLVDRITDTFAESLNDTSWMSNSTKREALYKLEKMTRKIGYPDTNFDEEYFEQLYENLTMAPDTHYENTLTNRKNIFYREYRRMLKPKDTEEWLSEPYQANAYYFEQFNDMLILAGILQPPFYSPDFPDAMVYGAIGYVVGHELTHGFDTKGSKLDALGNRRNWWLPEDWALFINKTKCIEEQYSNFRDESAGVNLNGTKALEETIADNSGLRQSYRTYRKLVEEKGESAVLPGLGLTNDQLFFLAFGQMYCDIHTNSSIIERMTDHAHPNGRYRILGALQNSPEFAEAYKCQLGSYMNPVEKCRVW